MATLGHAVIRHQPCPCTPGEGKAQAVWCFPHAQPPSSWDGLGDPSRGKAGQTYLEQHPVKGRRVEVMKCCSEISSLWHKLAQAELSAVVSGSQTNQAGSHATAALGWSLYPGCSGMPIREGALVGRGCQARP